MTLPLPFCSFFLCIRESNLIVLFLVDFTGFRSRVKFFSVLDPRKICSYISEVVDAGLIGPLFKVDFPQ